MQEEKSYSGENAGLATSAAMPTADAVRSLIRDRAKKLGLKFKPLSLGMGRNHSYLSQFLRGKFSKLDETPRKKLAELLDIDEVLLRVEESRKLNATIEPRNARIGGAVRLDGTVPAFGHARGGRDGQFPLNGNRLGDIMAPPKVAKAKNGYAVYVAGDSMEPRYAAGEVVFVIPGLPVRQGNYVVAQIKGTDGEPPEAYIKRFVSQDSKRLKLEQLNPKKFIEFPAGRVVSVDKIIMGGED